ncbi:hypothetical protein K443DRAFT_132368 [Laccaria amethystina LaAM-08-1]|uniref:RING-type domain-containing protein n=1 Tax=Laccaria amethystina LaAM-08-1 TaxID=1095629 RepID=A0A0C9XU79_9AGAR|nr:hypothetical protein K443DRAFT_132368 [Laccaria amethystina LaAM-08-1]
MFLPQINFHEGICLTWFSNQFLRLVRAFRNFEAVEAGELDGGSESVCGHVFCADCLHNLTRPACPLCRHAFNPNLTVKLRVELDTTRASPTPSVTIAGIAEAGSTESNLRRLIEDGRAFLRQQPRSLYRDLRTAHQMILYLCEVKSNLRSQNKEVDTLTKQVAELAEQKADLAKQVEDLTVLRKMDSETAIAWKNSLPGVNRTNLRDAAVQNPNSYTVSPLPQFTGALNTDMSLFMPLHELEEDDGEDGDEEEEEEVEDNADPSEHLKYGLVKKTYPGRSESPGYKFGYGYRHSFPRPTGSPGSPIPGLSRTAPAQEHCRSRPSSFGSRPSSATSSSVDVHQALSSPKPQSPTRLHDLLYDPSVSSSLPNMTPNHFPTSLAHRDSHHDEDYAPRRTLSDRRITQAGPSPGPLFAVHPSHPSMSHVPVPNPRPLTSNGSSIASAAAKALEKAKKQQEKYRKRAEKERTKVDWDSTRSRTNSTPLTSHPRERERASSNANAPWSSTFSFSSGNSRSSPNSSNPRGSSSSVTSLPPPPRSSSSNGPVSRGSRHGYTSAASKSLRGPLGQKRTRTSTPI